MLISETKVVYILCARAHDKNYDFHYMVSKEQGSTDTLSLPCYNIYFQEQRMKNQYRACCSLDARWENIAKVYRPSTPRECVHDMSVPPHNIWGRISVDVTVARDHGKVSIAVSVATSEGHLGCRAIQS